MSHMVIIPEQETASSEKSHDRVFQLMQLRFMKELLTSFKEGKSAKASKGDKELTHLISTLMKASRQQVSALKGMKSTRLNLDGLEGALKRAIPKSTKTIVTRQATSPRAPSTSGLKSSISRLERTVSALSTKMGNGAGLNRRQMGRLEHALATAGKSRNRTFGSNF